MASPSVRVDLKNLKRLHDALKKESSGQPGPLDRAFKQWSVRYKAFIRERFDAFSKGGGDWPPLAPSTIARRRKGKGSKKFKKGTIAILRDTGLLFSALDPAFIDKPGMVTTRRSFGITIGYGGPHMHGDGPATIADIASFHQSGGPYLPQRRIIVPPSAYVRAAMREDLLRALRKIRGG